MDKGDRVQSKRKFRLVNAVVESVTGDRVMVSHDVWRKKWIGQRPQLGRTTDRKRVCCRFYDLFDIEKLEVIHG